MLTERPSILSPRGQYCARSSREAALPGRVSLREPCPAIVRGAAQSASCLSSPQPGGELRRPESSRPSNSCMSSATASWRAAVASCASARCFSMSFARASHPRGAHNSQNIRFAAAAGREMCFVGRHCRWKVRGQPWHFSTRVLLLTDEEHVVHCRSRARRAGACGRPGASRARSSERGGCRLCNHVAHAACTPRPARRRRSCAPALIELQPLPAGFPFLQGRDCFAEFVRAGGRPPCPPPPSVARTVPGRPCCACPLAHSWRGPPHFHNGYWRSSFAKSYARSMMAYSFAQHVVFFCGQRR